MSWFSKRKSLRRRKSAAISVAAEVFESRALLAQLVPVEGFLPSYLTVVYTAADSTLFASDGPQSDTITLQSLDHATETLSTPQVLPGSSNIVASADGKTIATKTVDSTGLTTVYFYKRGNSGLLEESARHDVPPGRISDFPTLDSIVSSVGGYVRRSTSFASTQILWLSADDSAEQKVVFDGGFFESADIVRSGNQDFLVTDTGGTRLINRGVPGQESGPANLVPQVRLNNHQISFTRDYQGDGRQITSTDLSTGTTVALADTTSSPGYIPQVLLLLSDDGPAGKAVFLSGTSTMWKVIVTDGTTAGTTIFSSAAMVDSFAGQSTAVFVRETQRIIVNWAGQEIWSFDLNSATWQQVIDSNIYGDDRVGSLMLKDDGAWFLAMESDGDYGLYRTDGVQTENVSDFVNVEGRTLIGDGDSTWVVDNTPLPALPFNPARLYKVQQNAPSTAIGPKDLSFKFRAQISGRTLHIEWSPRSDAQFYEVFVMPFNESGRGEIYGGRLQLSASSVRESSVDFALSNDEFYGWHTIHVRAIDSHGMPSEWSSIPLVMTDALSPPGSGKFLVSSDELRFGVPGFTIADWTDVSLIVRNSHDSTILWDLRADVRWDLIDDQTPFQQSDAYYYFYFGLPDLQNGDYLVTLRRQYRDPNPTPVDMTLPPREVTYPLSLRREQIVGNPESLNVTVESGISHFSWAGTLQGTETGFELLVNDLSRGIPRVINTTVAGHSYDQSLPNGRYRAFVGVKDSGTGRMVWSLAKEFVVTRQIPLLINPVVESNRARPTFQWTGDKAFDYEVWVNDLGTGKRVTLDRVSRSNQWTPSIDLPVGQYAIWVRQIVTTNAVSSWSSRHVFVQREPAVVVTSGLNPGLDQTPTFGWGDRSDAVSYEIWINKAGTLGPVYSMSGLKGTSHTPAQPLGNGTFTVWVRAMLADGRTTAWGPGQTMVIGQPVVLSTIGSSLAWTNSPTATHYEVWINYEGGEGPKAAKILNITSLKATVLSLPTGLLKGRYRAWVRAIRQEGGSLFTGEWSKAVEFTV